MPYTLKCINALTGKPFIKTVDDTPDCTNRLALTPEEIAGLPTIDQVVEFCRNAEKTLINDNFWMQQNISAGMPTHQLPMDKDNPDVAYFNNAPADKFIVSRLQSGRYALKPNLSTRPLLYRGQHTVHKSLATTFQRKSPDQRLISNLKYADFLIALRSHPLFRLFDSGIYIDSYNQPMFFEMNYYGLAQHYGFNTGLLDFSSDIDVAAFFATTKAITHDTYEPYRPLTPAYGAIYVVEIDCCTTFKFEGYSTIGLQVFPRSGAQKGFCHGEDQASHPSLRDINTHKRLMALPFRHDADKNAEIFNRWHEGLTLFPADGLTPISNDILASDKVSLEAFAYNLYVNPTNDEQTNRQRCEQAGITISPNVRWEFTPDTLVTYYDNIRNGWWDKFCDQIHFGDTEADRKAIDSMRRIATNPAYRQYFDPHYYSRLFHHSIHDRHAAHRR